MTDQTPDAIDAMVAAIDPTLSPLGVQSRDVVLVAGPWLAGSTSLVAALRTRLPGHTFVEADELGTGEAPVAVVFAVSAMAPLTDSDCALLDSVAADTDLVVGAVTKIDTHRNWRDVLASDRTLLAQHEQRYEPMQWVGVAAAPDLGDPRVDDLVGVLRQRLTDPDLARRNRLRAWETHLQGLIRRHQADGDGADRAARVAALHKTRDDILRGRRLSKSERTISLRSQIQQARVQLTHFARNRCTSVRQELQEDGSQLSRREVAGFAAHVRTRVAAVVGEVDDGATTHLRDMATELRLPAPPVPAPPSPPAIGDPALRSRRLETQLTMVLGTGFGLGVALAVTRLFAGVAPELTIAGLLAGGVVGLLVTVWVVGIRGLLQDRAVLDRWVNDVVTALRSAVEERVATRVLAAETTLTTELAVREDQDSATAADQVAEIDAELRQHAVETAKAAALRDRRLPNLSRALDAVRTELRGPRPAEDATDELTESIHRATSEI